MKREFAGNSVFAEEKLAFARGWWIQLSSGPGTRGLQGRDDLDLTSARETSASARRKRRIIWLALVLSTLIALIFARAVFENFSYWGAKNWDQHFFYQAASRETITKYHQFPLWNPYYCGGTVLLTNPQSRFLSPSFPLVLIFGAVVGSKLEIILYLIIGLLGMYALARHYRMDAWTAALPAFVYMFSGMYALNLAAGMTWFLSVAYLPWVYLLYLLSFKRWEYVLLSSLFLVLIFFGGGAYTPGITVLLFFTLFSLLSIPQYGIRKVAKSFSILLVFTICLGAIKFVPSFFPLREHPRHVSDYSGYSAKMLMHSLFDREQSPTSFEKYPQTEGLWDGMSHGVDENSMYIGFAPVLLFLLGIVVCFRRHWPLAVCFLIFLWLSLGDRIPFSLWRLLHNLPIYDSMQVAQRFRIVFMFCLALFAGLGLQSLQNLLNKRKKRRRFLRLLTSTIPIIVLGVLVDLTLVNSPIFEDAFTIPPLPVERQEKFAQVSKLNNYDANGFLTENSRNADSSWSALYPAFLSNLGTVDGSESPTVPGNAIPGDSENYRGEVFFQETSGELSIDHWSPNHVTVSIRPDEAGYLILNQNYYPGWKVRGPSLTEVQDLDSLLAVKIVPGDQIVEFYYLPIGFEVGLVITCLAILAGIILGIRRRRLDINQEFSDSG